tara:strand:+ start:233 stop:769 length:537 start_codon:yes stop_codon:yes gene_type:complete
MKTLRLIESYMRLLEQDVDIEETDVEVDVEVEEKPPAPGVQAIAELIAAAFAYLPTDEEADEIDNIEIQKVGTHNVAPPTNDPNPRSVIKNVVARLPVGLRAVYTRGPGFSGITPESEIYLAQILADAFRYKPKPQEAHIASTVNDEFNDTEPMKVIETIERLLQFSDEPLQDELLDY